MSPENTSKTPRFSLNYLPFDFPPLSSVCFFGVRNNPQTQLYVNIDNFGHFITTKTEVGPTLN